MNIEKTREAMHVIAEAIQPGDNVAVAYHAESKGLIIIDAASQVLDALTDEGFYLSVELGALTVCDAATTREGDEDEAE